MKRGIIISFFILCSPFFWLAASDFEGEGTRWYSLHKSPAMESLLVIELMPGGICYTTHAYLREGEDLPFEQERVKEYWYYTGMERLFLTDNWGEFASFKWTDGTLVTKIGKETITLIALSETEWARLKEHFSLIIEEETGQ